MLPWLRSPALRRFVLLYAAMYAGFGAASPFLPAFLESRALTPQEIGLVLSAGTAMRLLSGPAVSRLADRLAALRAVLAGCAAASAAVTLCYLPADGLWLLLLVGVGQAAALAPITTLADALALAAAARRRAGFEYGWVRGSGSAAFILGSILSGRAIAALGLAAILPLQAALLGAAAWFAMRVPERTRRSAGEPHRQAASNDRLGALLRLALFRRLIVVAALVLGSHAMHDAFAVIRWSAAGIAPTTVSLLWSESVAAEVAVFFILGPTLLDRLGPGRAMGLAAIAAIVRWSVMGATANVAVLALIQPLHGLTFALLHLACMRVLGKIVPPGLAATAQAIYGTFAIGGATAVLTLASGFLFARLGAHGFWIMAALCVAALPLTRGLDPQGQGTGQNPGPALTQ